MENELGIGNKNGSYSQFFLAGRFPYFINNCNSVNQNNVRIMFRLKIFFTLLNAL